MMLLSQAANALRARMEGADVHFAAVSTDTRTIQPGDLFIALKGENFDGVKFVAQAAQAGAVAAMVSEQGYAQIRPILDPNLQFWLSMIRVWRWASSLHTGAPSSIFRWSPSPAATARPR